MKEFIISFLFDQLELKKIYHLLPLLVLLYLLAPQLTFTYSKSIIETLEKGVKYAQI